MKFFNRMQNKFNGGQGNKKLIVANDQAKLEQFSSWSKGLLTIGTFGNRDQREDQEIQCAAKNSENDHEIHHQECSSLDDLAEFTPEEVGKLQKELTTLLKRKPTNSAASKAPPSEDAADDHLLLERFLNCTSSSDVDEKISNKDGDQEDIDRTIRVIIGRCKEICMENKKKAAIGKMSISFLLKKMFVCRSGFAPTPSLRDPLLESRIEKLLRTMLSKKTYPENASRASPMKRFFGNSHTQKAEKYDEKQDKKQEICKWVKTDSEYIVLDLH